MIAIKTEISDSIDTAPSEVEVEPTQTINEVKKSTTLPECFELVTSDSLQQKRRVLSLLNHAGGLNDRQEVIGSVSITFF